MTALKIANGYGNYDLAHNDLPKGYVLVRGQRLQPLCRKLGIKYVPAVTDWSKTHRRYPARPVIGGVIVTARQAPRLQGAIADREAKQQDPAYQERRKKAAAARKARQERERAEWEGECDRLGIYDADGRLARRYRAGAIDEDEAMLMAFRAGYRHEHTDYEARLDDLRSVPREYRDDAYQDAREMREDNPIPSTWAEYLDTYSFPLPEIAAALAAVLRDPRQCHPVWFCEAIIAVKRAGLPLAGLTYERIRDAISDWRNERSWDDD